MSRFTAVPIGCISTASPVAMGVTLVRYDWVVTLVCGWRMPSIILVRGLTMSYDGERGDWMVIGGG